MLNSRRSLSTTSSIYNLDYRIEGFDIASLLNWSDTSNDTSKYITLAFYMKTDKAFIFTVGLINSGIQDILEGHLQQLLHGLNTL